MYKNDKLITCIVGIVILIVSVLKKDIFSSEKYDLSNLITFLSIILGFQIGAFTLLFSSPTVRDLYQIKDKENNRITQKHRLKNYYRTSFLVSILSILFLISFDNQNKLFVETKYSSYFICTLPAIIFLNVYVLFKTNFFLYKIFIKDSSK